MSAKRMGKKRAEPHNASLDEMLRRISSKAMAHKTANSYHQPMCDSLQIRGINFLRAATGTNPLAFGRPQKTSASLCGSYQTARRRKGWSRGNVSWPRLLKLPVPAVEGGVAPHREIPTHDQRPAQQNLAAAARQIKGEGLLPLNILLGILMLGALIRCERHSSWGEAANASNQPATSWRKLPSLGGKGVLAHVATTNVKS